MGFDPKQHYENSSLRENIIEHLFIGAALRQLWRSGIVNVEILRSEFDAYGYDLVISSGEIVRHVQLKSGTKPKTVSVSELLAEKPSGCAISLLIDDGLELGPYLFFGASAGLPLPDLEGLTTTKRTTPNRDNVKPLRRRHKDIPISRFTRYDNLEGLLDAILKPIAGTN